MTSDVFEVLGWKRIYDALTIDELESFANEFAAQRLIDASVRTQLPVELSGC